MNLRPILWRLETRFSYRAKAQRAAFTIANRLPHWLREAVIVNAAVRAAAVEVIGPHAYAGPDGLDYKRLMDFA
jgi:hypothetical protein